jgi:Spy/CpxP family protein refolding chaperone
MKPIFIAALAALAIPLSAATIQSQAQASSLFSEPNTTNISQRPLDTRSSNYSRDQRIERMLQQLDLTPEQEAQITTIREESRDESEALKQKMRTNQQQMKSLLANDASSEELRQQHRQIQNLAQQIGDRRFEAMLQIREVLTPEQRAQMAQLTGLKQKLSPNKTQTGFVSRKNV